MRFRLLRRRLLTFFVCVLIFLAALCGRTSADEQPNVLFLLADDHAAYVTGCYGNEQARTPNLDRLASQGVRFDRAYCNAPVCTASRQSLLTGRYPRTIGVTLLRTALPDHEATLAEIFAAPGYQTAAIGKMHFNSNLRHGFDLRVDLPEHRRWLAERGEQPLPPGLDVLPVWRPFHDPARVWLNGFYRPHGAVDADMAGTYFARRAAEFIAAPRERPFFLMVSFHEPHSPFRFPVEYHRRHDPASFAVPDVGPEDDDQIPAIFRDLTHEEKQGVIAAYYTSTEFMDSNVGRVLDALDASGLSENTLVVYAGDHGYMLGQHGRFEKHCSFEEAVRAPLLIRYPSHVRPETTSDAFVEFVDLAPTILEYCGLDVPANLQGRSLVPLMAGETDRLREFVVVEYAQNDEVMIRDARWKLVYQRGQRRRTDGYDTGLPLPGPQLGLYDLEQDPAEMRNVADEPEHAEVVERLLDMLVRHMIDTARRPELIPTSTDPLAVLDFCVQPRDVSADAE